MAKTITLQQSDAATGLPAQEKQRGANPFGTFLKGRSRKITSSCQKSILNDVKALRHWVRLCIEYVASLPEPVRKKRK